MSPAVSNKAAHLAMCVLASLLVMHLIYAQQPIAGDAIQQQIGQLPANPHVALHLSDGNTVRGRIMSHNDHDFALKLDKTGAAQTIAYKDVAAVEQVHGQHSKTKWIVIGAVTATAVAVAVIAIHVVHSPTINGI